MTAAGVHTGPRLTVVGPGSAMDLAVPSDIPLALLVAQLVRLVGGPAAARPRSWTLTRDLGGELDLDRSATENDLHEGDIVLLVDAAQAPAGPSQRDLVELVTAVADTRSRRWSGRGTRIVTAALCVLVPPTVAVAAADLGPTVLPIVGPIVTAGSGVLLTAAVWALRSRLDPVLSTVWLAVLVSTWASIGWSIAHLAGGDLFAILIASGGGALLAAVAARWVLRPAAPTAAGLVVASGFVILTAVAAEVGATVPVVAGTAAFLVLLTADLVATSVVTVSGLGATEGDTVTPSRLDAIRARAASTSAYATAMTWALAVVAAVAVCVLELTAGPYALGLGAASAVALLLQARSHTSMARVVAFASSGAVAALAVTIAALATGPATRAVTLGVALAVGVAALIITVIHPSNTGRIRLGRWLDRLDKVAVFVGPPLILGVAGVYTAVAGWF